MSNLSEGLIKGLISMGLDKLVAGQLKKFQQEDNCPKSLKKVEAKELVGDAMHFMKFNKEQQADRKAYGERFFRKYFAILEPMIMQYLLMQELKAGAKYELQLSIDNDSAFFEHLDALKANPAYESKIYPQLEQIVQEEDSDIENAIFNMIRSMMEAQGNPVSLQCTIVKRNMKTGESLSQENRRVSEIRQYFQKQSS